MVTWISFCFWSISVEVFSQFTDIVGRQQLPPLFALGYHNVDGIIDEKDVASVEACLNS